MAVPKAVAQQMADEWSAPSTPTGSPDEPPPEAQKGWTFGQSVENFAGDVAASAKHALQGVDTLEKAMLYGVFKPFMPEEAPKFMRPVMEGQTEKIEQRVKEPKTVAGKVLGGPIEGAVATAAMPIPGGIGRNIIAGMGMGVGAEIGGPVLGGLFNYFGGETGRRAGEATGQILGGGLGAQANVMRMRALGEAGTQTAGALKSVVPAFQSARAKQIAGDERYLWQIFADEFGSLRAQTRGIVQDFVNRNLAATIKKDIRASQMAEDFMKDAKMTGIDVKPWGLGERTMVPTLTETIASARPESYAEASEVAGRAKSMQTAIRNAYGKLVQGSKIPVTPDGIVGSAKAFQEITQAKVDALTAETGQIKQAFPQLDAAQEFQVGEQARKIRDQLRDQAYAQGSARYQLAEELWNAEGAQVDAGAVRTGAKDILAEFYSKVKPEEVPPVVRNLLGATAPKEGAAAAEGLILPADIAAERAAAETAKEAAGRPLTLKDANDLYKALGEAGANATAAEKYTAANRAKALQRELTDSIMNAPASPEAKKAWSDAVQNWRTQYAERFQEGLGKALGKERGGTFAGREAIKSEKIMDEALSGATAMQEFDKVYAGNPGAQGLLRAGLENKFRKEVFDRPFTDRTFESNLDAFKRKYAPGLEQFPDVAEKIDRQAATMLTKQGEKAAELQRYRDLMGADVTKAVGPIQAKQMFESALADPLKMERLLAAYKGAPTDLVQEVFKQGNPFRNGEYDPDGLLRMVQAGKKDANSPSSMEILFTKAFGAKEAERHLATLEAIANFTKRQAATDPRYLQGGALLSNSPVKEATGSAMSSWISYYRSTALGQTSPTYALSLGLSRFANAKVQTAIEKAKHRALYDPQTADAILEMVATPMTQPLSLTTARKIFGDIRVANGQKLIDRLIDRGYVKQYVSRGIIYGEEKALQDQTDPTTRTGARSQSNAAQER